MTPMRTTFPALFLAGLLAGGCAAAPEKAAPPSGYLPEVVDQREAPLVMAKKAESGGTRLYVDEAFFGPPLIDLFLREVTLHRPLFPEQTTLALREMEVSIFVPADRLALDPSRAMRETGTYRPEPGKLVLDERGREAHTVRVVLGCHHEGRWHQIELTDTVSADEVRQRAEVLFEEAVGALLDQLATPG